MAALQPFDSGARSAQRFLERIRSTFSHDLRTPLGVIVNYAAVLESPAATAHEEVQNLARSIRGNAQRASDMLARLVEAMEFASAAPHVSNVDLAVLARAALAQAGGQGDARLAEGATGAKMELEGGPLQYAWRAYLAVVVGCYRGGSRLSLAVRTHSGGTSYTIDLCCCERGGEPTLGVPTSDEAFDEPEQFLRRTGVSTRTANAVALGLAKDLILARGGELSTWGDPTAKSAVRVRVPVS